MSNYKNPVGTNLNVNECPHYSKSLVTDSKAVQKVNEVIEAELGLFIMTENFTIELEYKDHEGVVSIQCVGGGMCLEQRYTYRLP